MQEQTIAFIGGGNMADSLVGGLIAGGHPPERIWVADPFIDQLDSLVDRHQIHVTQENSEAASHADVILMATKPQVLAEAAAEIRDVVVERQPLVLSIAAGIREPDLRRWLGGEAAVVRAMPNTPSLLGAGATALYANPEVTDAQKETARGILETVGLAIWVDEEDHMDVVTATSGSGPAYFFYVMEAMTRAAEELGLDADTASQLVRQTALGAARMASEGTDDPATLRQKVTSPGGTTAAALEALESGDLEKCFARALTAARDRSRSLSEEFGKN